MTKIIDKNYIKKHTKNSLYQLQKKDLLEIVKKYNINCVKTNSTKEDIVNIITKTKGINYLDIYNTYKTNYFGLYPTELESLLGINKNQRKKINDLIKIAYYCDTKADWGHISVPYYLLESIYNLTKEELDAWKEKHPVRIPTKKQIEARERIKREKTCLICREYYTQKTDLIENLCFSCYSKEKKFKHSLNMLKDMQVNKDKYIVINMDVLYICNNYLVKIVATNLNNNILLDVCLNLEETLYFDILIIPYHNNIGFSVTEDSALKDFVIIFNNVIKNKVVLLNRTSPSNHHFNSSLKKIISPNTVEEIYYLDNLENELDKIDDSSNPPNIFNLNEIEMENIFNSALKKCLYTIDTINKLHDEFIL